MAAPILGVITLPYPNSFSVTNNPKGAYTQTLDGTIRRNIHATKKVYVLTFQNLSTSTYDEIETEYLLETTRDFIWDDLSIYSTVHIDLSPREFINGNAGYYSIVTITLTEV